MTTTTLISILLQKNHGTILRKVDKFFEAFNNKELYYKESTYASKSNKATKCYILTKEGAGMFASAFRGKEQLKYYQWLFHTYSEFNFDKEQIGNYIRPDTKEKLFIDMVEEVAGYLGKSFEKEFVVDMYRIDGYFPSERLCIEYDQEFHNHQKEADKQREDYLKDKLGCSFVRVSENDSNEINLVKVLKALDKE